MEIKELLEAIRRFNDGDIVEYENTKSLSLTEEQTKELEILMSKVFDIIWMIEEHDYDTPLSTIIEFMEQNNLPSSMELQKFFLKLGLDIE